MRSTLPLLASGLMLSLFTLTTAPTLAQTPAACDFDLSGATALLMQAQAKASSGDTAGGLALLDQAQQQLSGIQAECSENDAGSIPALTETYTPESKAFTVSYPEGWITTSLSAPSEGEKTPLNTVLFANSPNSADAMQSNKTADDLLGYAVYVGTPTQLAIGMGAFKADLDYDVADAEALYHTILKGVDVMGGTRFDDSKPVTVGDHQGIQAHVWEVETADPSAPKPIYDGSLVIFPLSETQYAAVLGVITPERVGFTNREKVAALALAAANTIQPGD